MKKRTKIILTAVTALAVVSTTAVVAGGRHAMGDRMVNKISERLELNEQQVSDLQGLQTQIQETRQLMRGDLDTDGQTLGDLLGAETFDQGAALEMITTRTTAMQAQGPELVAAAAQFFDGLDAEQKQQLNEQFARFAEHRGKRHGRHDK